PRIPAACPVAWRPWLGGEGPQAGPNSWTARMAGEARQFAPIVSLVKDIARATAGLTKTDRVAASDGKPKTAVPVANGAAGSTLPSASPVAGGPVSDSVASASRSPLLASLGASLPDSTLRITGSKFGPHPEGPPFAARPESTVLRAQLGGLIR
ncbi:MAG TPA: hypothetical protein VFM17_08705, partial [Candidatus Eisenbacteria bacterium]|nr:hypothetical protein [Candidatus Eisenbacteria bacterium]